MTEIGRDKGDGGGGMDFKKIKNRKIKKEQQWDTIRKPLNGKKKQQPNILVNELIS